MTAIEYRDVLCRMTIEQRKELCEALMLGGKPEDINGFVWLFEYHGKPVEAHIVHHLRRIIPGCQVKSEDEKVGSATILSAEYARRGYIVSSWAIGIAIISAILSLVALFK